MSSNVKKRQTDSNSIFDANSQTHTVIKIFEQVQVATKERE